MKLDHATAEDIRAVALAMREEDFAEFIALTPVDDRKSLAEILVARWSGREDVLTVFHDDRPVAIGGFIEARPNVVTALFFATDEFASTAALATTYFVHRIFQQLKLKGVHRLEAVSSVAHAEAHRWMAHFKMLPEGPPMRGYGKNGEAYQMFAWVSDDCPAGR